MELEIDPVCHVQVESNSLWVTEHDGKDVHFCSPKCKVEFDADPGQYDDKVA